MANRFDPTIDKLINSQTQFVNGVAPVNFASSTVPVTNAFSPNLNRALNTGFRSDTGAAAAAGESAANRLFGKTVAGIDERAAAGGLTKSSAQSGQIAQAGSDLSAQLQEMLARLNFDADESASGRRMQAFDAALGEGTLANQTRGLDQNQANLELQGRSQQASAGQDLLSSLLREKGMFQNSNVNSVNNMTPAQRQMEQAQASMMRSQAQSMLPNNVRLAQKMGINDQLALASGMQGIQTNDLAKRRAGLQNALHENMRAFQGRNAIYGAHQGRDDAAGMLTDPNTIAALSEMFGLGSSGAVGAGSNQAAMLAAMNQSGAAAAPQFMANQGQAQQNQFMNAMAQNFGPKFMSGF